MAQKLELSSGERKANWLITYTLTYTPLFSFVKELLLEALIRHLLLAHITTAFTTKAYQKQGAHGKFPQQTVTSFN